MPDKPTPPRAKIMTEYGREVRPKKPYPAFCRDCKHSKPESERNWNNKCFHPIVNAQDSWALATNPSSDGHMGHGSDCRSERERTSWRAPCGMKAKLWEPRDADDYLNRPVGVD